MKGGGNNASSETISAQAADIIQFFDQVNTAVLRMRMTSGYPIDRISFRMTSKLGNGNAHPGYNDNPNCTTDQCRIFIPSGGNVIYRSFESYTDPSHTNSPGSIHSGHVVIYRLPWTHAGTDANDIVMRIHGLKREICDELNAKLGITAQPNVGGTYANASAPSTWDDPGLNIISNPGQVSGKSTFGIRETTSCTIYHLLLTR